MTYLGGKTHRRLGREILRRHRADKSQSREHGKHAAHFEDILPVPRVNAVIYYRRHHKRNDKLKHSLGQLEKRRQNAFLLIVL